MSHIEKESEHVGALKAAEAFEHIEYRDEKWRFKGRRSGVIDAILGMEARNEACDVLASDLQISVTAVEEAQQFVHSNPKAVSEHQRRMIKIANENSHR